MTIVKSSLAILIIFGLYGSSFHKTIKIKCPEECHCDMVENLRRAECTNNRLLYLNGIIPSETEILDYSYNYVAILYENQFINDKLTDLIKLNLSHNKINDIHIHAFTDMNQLKLLDLSNNAISYVLNEWFTSTQKLEELYLNDNNLLIKHNKEPFLISKSLKVLNLARTKIDYLHEEMFTALPNLIYLDISENFLISLSLKMVKPLIKLQTINFIQNAISCDNNFKDFQEYINSKNIKYNYDDCNFKKFNRIDDGNGEKFQKMQLAPTENEEETGWTYEVTTEISNCITTERDENTYNMIFEMYTYSTLITVVTLLTLGFMFGLIVGCVCQIYPKEKKKAKVKRNSSVIRHIRRNRNEELLLEDPEELYKSTPIPLRRFE